jgi:hypothetical protein
VQSKVPQYARDINKCYNDRGQLRCQQPRVLPGSVDYSLVPRYAAIIDELRSNGPAISRTPTHVLIAAADLMARATRGGEVKRQLPRSTLVTLVRTDGEYAYVAKDGEPLGYVLRSVLDEIK